MNAMCRNLRFAAIYGTVSILLMLSACITLPGLPQTPSAPEMLMLTPAQTAVPCDACVQATLAVALTQEKNNADNQAAAAAEVVRANAQATLNSANATLSAVQTQQQNDANVIAAQIAATAEIVRANAQATLIAAGSTQSAALTQDAIRQTQMVDLATTGAQAIVNQQYQDELAAGTQTAVANTIATQARQSDEQRQGPITFLWMWCLPIFILLFAGLVLWGFWRWLKIQQANQRILENPVERLPAQAVEVPHHHHHHDGSLPYFDGDVADDGYQVTKPDDQVEQWLDEVKDKLRDSDEKDKDDNTND